MAEWMPKIVASPDYKRGNLVVVLTADTSAGSDPSNHLATIVITPSCDHTPWRQPTSTTTRCCE